jgi:hypothetical protein
MKFPFKFYFVPWTGGRSQATQQKEIPKQLGIWRSIDSDLLKQILWKQIIRKKATKGRVIIQSTWS